MIDAFALWIVGLCVIAAVGIAVHYLEAIHTLCRDIHQRMKRQGEKLNGFQSRQQMHSKQLNEHERKTQSFNERAGV